MLPSSGNPTLAGSGLSTAAAVAGPPKGGPGVGRPDDSGRAEVGVAGPAFGRPILDSNAQNLPRIRNPRWTKQQFRIRAQLRDSMRWWQANGWACFFLTLTSSPASPLTLPESWQALRKRIARDLELDPADVQYQGVRTDEGHGVLHLLLAVPRSALSRSTFLVDAAALRAWWGEIHGATFVNIKAVQHGQGHVRRLTRYIVTQYVAGQAAAIRKLGSRLALPLTRLRRSFRELVFGHPGRFSWVTFPAESVGEERIVGETSDQWKDRVLAQRGAVFRSVLWDYWRAAWGTLLDRGSTWVFGDQVVLWNGEITAV